MRAYRTEPTNVADTEYVIVMNGKEVIGLHRLTEMGDVMAKIARNGGVGDLALFVREFRNHTDFGWDTEEELAAR